MRVNWRDSAREKRFLRGLGNRIRRLSKRGDVFLRIPYYYTCAFGTWPDTAATSNTLRKTHRALEQRHKYNRRIQHFVARHSSHMRSMSGLRDPAEYISETKHRWAGHIMRRTEARWTLETLEWIPSGAFSREATEQMG
ncbi:unnamed protein product [Strongylus vulgaris]|uniref:Uncharacterized protein n=1 Tax=Strongylus vulgaris TaxID=40348 RepID=A0A3P7KFX5_STRVU|nr:unnamed protein product [Strongylus vulgaris]